MMRTKLLILRTASIVAVLLAALCLPAAVNAHGGGGGGGGGHGGGGFGGGGHGGWGGGGGHWGGGGWGGGRSGWSGGWGGGHAYSGFSGARSFAAPANRSGNFSGFAGNHGFNSFGGNNFNGRFANDFNRGFYNRGFGNRGFYAGGFYGGGFWPGWGWGWGGYWPWWDAGWGYPYAYSLYDYYPDNGYYYTYDTSPYDQGSYVAGTTVSNMPQTTATIPEEQQGASEAMQYYAKARLAFVQGDYRKALRLGAHAEIEVATNAKVHELLSLGLFASGNYPVRGKRGARRDGVGADCRLGRSLRPLRRRRQVHRLSCVPWRKQRPTIPRRRPTTSCSVTST